MQNTNFNFELFLNNIMSNASVIEALRNSSKGQLRYDKNWAIEGRTKQLLDEISSEIINLNISPKALKTVLNTSIDSTEDVRNVKFEKSTNWNNSPNLNKSEPKETFSSSDFKDYEYMKKVLESEQPIIDYENMRQHAVDTLLKQKLQEYERFNQLETDKFHNIYNEIRSKLNEEIQLELVENIDQQQNNIQHDENQLKVIEESTEQVLPLAAPSNQVSDDRTPKDTENIRLQEQVVLKQQLVFLHRDLINVAIQVAEKYELCPEKRSVQMQWEAFNENFENITQNVHEAIMNETSDRIATNTDIQIRKLINDSQLLITEANELIQSISSNIEQEKLKTTQGFSSSLPSYHHQSLISPSVSDIRISTQRDNEDTKQEQEKLKTTQGFSSSLPSYHHQSLISPSVSDIRISTQRDNEDTKQVAEMPNLPTEAKMETSKHIVDTNETIQNTANFTSPVESIVSPVKSITSPVESNISPVESIPEAMEECQDTEDVKQKEKTVSAEVSKETKIVNMFQEYVNAIKYLTNVENDVKIFATDPKNKKYRLDLHKGVITPINAIASCTGSHLRDKINRLCTLLSGRMVSCGGSYTSCQNNPHALAYCKKLIAERIVSQAEDQIASQFTAAFPIAAVIVAVCSKFPDVWTLILGQLYRRCPFLVPYYPERDDGQSDEDFYTSLGYKYSNDKLEEKDKYLKRMSGFMRLYASILYTSSSMNISSSHLHGLARGWMWLTQVLNTEPRLDITATLIFDFLDVLGNSMGKQYGRQFKKLLHVLCKDFFQNITSVTPSGISGPTSRLENFLQSAIKKGEIAPPKGILTSSFWQT